MAKALFIFAIFYVQLSFAQDRCADTFAAEKIRIELGTEELRMIPLNKSYRHQLTRLFLESDVSRFFIGQRFDKEIVSRHILRAESDHGESRENFDGLWVISYKGEVGGYFVMAAVDGSWLPAEIAASFRKSRPDELHVAVGYALHPSLRGKGIATRALNIGVDFAKNTLKAKFVFASANNLNEPSSGVLLRNSFTPIHIGLERTKFVRRLDEL